MKTVEPIWVPKQILLNTNGPFLFLSLALTLLTEFATKKKKETVTHMMKQNPTSMSPKVYQSYKIDVV